LISVKQKTPHVLRLLWVAVLLLSNGCALFTARAPSPPLGRQEIAGIISSFKDRDNAVRTLVSSGTLTIQSQGVQSDAEVLIVARRDPSSMRIEITHSWGRPLLHILVDGPRLDILAFSEKRHYRGLLGSPFLLKQIPFPLDSDLLWSLASAYPVLCPYHQAQSEKGDQITLMNKQKSAIQVIELYPGSNLPRKVWLCRQGAAMSFSDFQNSSDVIYAREIGLSDADNTTRLTLEIRKMVFNKFVPEALFQQETPQDFEEVQL
jgi:hypothetical protein